MVWELLLLSLDRRRSKKVASLPSRWFRTIRWFYVSPVLFDSEFKQREWMKVPSR
jgi:hypothetical protein